MSRYLFPALPLALLLTGCASAPIPTNESIRIQVFEGVPPVPYESIGGKVTVSHGSSWSVGLVRRNRRAVITKLQLEAAERGADAVAISRTRWDGNRATRDGFPVRLLSFEYTPPIESPSDSDELRAIVPRSYDETWTDLVDAVASTFFSVKNFEKASGLLTLEYDSLIPGSYVDCGRWKTLYSNGEVESDVPYLDRPFDPETQRISINARINLRVEEVSPNATEVEVTALYIVQVPNITPDFRFRTNTRDEHVAGKRRAAGTPATRTCRASRALERELLDMIERS